VRTMNPRLLPIFLMLAILLAVIPIQAFGEEQAPAIEVLPGSPPKNYPIRVYVYPQAFQDEKSQELFQCASTQEIVATFHEVLHEFSKVVSRFTDEYPEYAALAQIRFVNVSSPGVADIVVKVVGMISANPIAYGVTYFSGTPVEIVLSCRVAEAGHDNIFNVGFHELFHALGLGHAKQRLTEDRAPELMRLGLPSRGKVYPSTLDLYALYAVHFGAVGGDVITLPSDLRYEMVVPYAAEIQALRQENAKLKNQLSTSSMLFEKLRQERDALRDKLAEANATIQDLNEQYQVVQSILDSYIRAYNTLQQKYENLRGNCSLLLDVCNQTYRELTAKLTNMRARYNQCANQFNNLYEDYQKLRMDYDDLAGRFSFLAVTYFAVVAILGGGALWVSLAYGALRGKYHELLEKLEEGEKT